MMDPSSTQVSDSLMVLAKTSTALVNELVQSRTLTLGSDVLVRHITGLTLVLGQKASRVLITTASIIPTTTSGAGLDKMQSLEQRVLQVRVKTSRHLSLLTGTEGVV